MRPQREQGIIAKPGLPNGSHMTNREDLRAFATFKPAYRQRQRQLLIGDWGRQAATDRSRLFKVGLVKEDFLKLLKGPFEKAFTEERNRLSWGGSTEHGTRAAPGHLEAPEQLGLLASGFLAVSPRLPSRQQQLQLDWGQSA